MKIRELGSNSGVKIMTYQLRTKETTRKTSQVPFGPQTQLKYQGVTQNHFPQLLGHQCPQLLVPSHWEQLLWPPPLFHSWECFTVPSVLLFIGGKGKLKRQLLFIAEEWAQRYPGITQCIKQGNIPGAGCGFGISHGYFGISLGSVCHLQRERIPRCCWIFCRGFWTLTLLSHLWNISTRVMLLWNGRAN